MSLASPVPSFGRIAIIGAGHVGAVFVMASLTTVTLFMGPQESAASAKVRRS